MKVTKIGHCCLLLEIRDTRLLIDPGNFSTGQNTLHEIDAILITHKHPDHCDVESLRTILKKNPSAQIITNVEVGECLGPDFSPKIVVDGDSLDVADVSVDVVGSWHLPIHESGPRFINIGFVVDDSFFYPGDALTHPGKSVDMLALPVTANWIKLSEAIDFALMVRPKKCFPVHDGALVAGREGAAYQFTPGILAQNGVDFVVLHEGESLNF